MATSRPAVRFSAIFIGVVMALSGVALLDEVALGGAVAWAMCTNVAALVAAIIRLFEPDVAAVGNQIQYGLFSCYIVPECTGIDLVGLFVAAVSAFPSEWRYKVAGFAIGVPALLALNVIRIIAIVQVGSRWPAAMEPLHLYIAPLIVLTVTLGLWLAWAEGASTDVSHS